MADFERGPGGGAAGHRMTRHHEGRRRFIKRCVMGGCGLALGGYTAWDLLIQGGQGWVHAAKDEWAQKTDALQNLAADAFGESGDVGLDIG